ncbi:protein SENESCENCE-ASSOCIATED GENE 21, mitochondrial [Typha latifolia]|uniref:protein SENESCENCE-ASSOCIATED GENE 21, mitochondrial n=1 Tax=Typha latifolia TaxID=4733 RepID=UPI003C2B83F1
MARVLSNGIAVLVNRRGYSAAAVAAVMGTGRRVEEKVAFMGGKRDLAGDTAAATSWVPDPVTGYYRPATGTGEIDAAELRALLLNQKSRV